MAIKRRNFNTKAVLDIIYPKVHDALSKGLNKWKQCMASFIQKRTDMLYDTAPYERIYYSDKDRDELYQALNLSDREIKEGLKQTYYWNVAKFKPSQAKDPVTIICLCIVRYFLLKNDKKSLDLALVYQSFSGKYYPSIHYGSFPVTAPSKYRHVMEYVVNHKLSQKYDLKSKGSVIGAIKSINDTWLEAYKKMIQSFDDEDVTYIIQQLHNRIKSFMINIATLYYEAYEEKEFIVYEKDSLPEEEGSATAYHLATNDTFRLQQYVENTMQKINTSQVDYKICKMCADANVKTEEVRSIFETILNNRSNIDIIREFISNMIACYLAQSDTKDVVSMQFFKYFVQPKPNSKDPLILRAKEIVEQLLDDNSIGYRKRKHRLATKASYYKAFCTYFAITIINANKH